MIRKNLIYLTFISISACSTPTGDKVETLFPIAAKIDSAIDKGDLQSIFRMIDWQYIQDSLVQVHNKDSTITLLKDFKEGALSNNLNFIHGDDILIRKTRQDNTSIIFEVYNGEQFEFIELKVNILKNAVVDVFNFNIGESIYSILDQDLALDMLKGDKRMINSFYELSKSSLVSGEIQKAWDYYELIPEDIRVMFPYRKLGFSIAEYDLSLYKELIDGLPATSDKRYLLFLNVRLALLNDRFDSIISYANDMKSVVGDSFVLDILKGYAYENIQDKVNAEKSYQNAIKLSPVSLSPAISLTEIMLEEEDFENAVEFIRSSKSLSKLSKPELIKIFSSYPDFLKSEQFEALKN